MKAVETMQRENTYRPGHPWYYVLGGDVLYPKQILENVLQDDDLYVSFNEIANADNKNEPLRSEALRKLREKNRQFLQSDLRRYREVIRELSAFRKEFDAHSSELTCESVHVNVSLKHNHIYYHLKFLKTVHNLLSVQPDLFDSLS